MSAGLSFAPCPRTPPDSSAATKSMDIDLAFKTRTYHIHKTKAGDTKQAATSLSTLTFLPHDIFG
jgi:hypothetical protein